MKSLIRVSSIFIVLSIAFASEAKKEMVSEVQVNNTEASNKQLLQSGLVPIDIEKINEVRIQKSIQDKKYAQKILKQHMDNNPNQKKDELSARKVDKKNVLKKWSADLRSKLSVVKFKGKNGEKTINLPSIPESN
tara:strand:- start:607 stop:1011 length:405 start_codon:yes stop_codon:yes gene_type:complete